MARRAVSMIAERMADIPAAAVSLVDIGVRRHRLMQTVIIKSDF